MVMRSERGEAGGETVAASFPGRGGKGTWGRSVDGGGVSGRACLSSEAMVARGGWELREDEMAV